MRIGTKLVTRSQLVDLVYSAGERVYPTEFIPGEWELCVYHSGPLLVLHTSLHKFTPKSTPLEMSKNIPDARYKT